MKMQDQERQIQQYRSPVPNLLALAGVWETIDMCMELSVEVAVKWTPYQVPEF